MCHVSPGSPRRVSWPPGSVPAVHPPRVGVRHVAQLQLGHVSVQTLWPARGTCHLVEAAEEVPDLHPPLAVRVEVESEPGALPLQELLPLPAGAGTVTSPVIMH